MDKVVIVIVTAVVSAVLALALGLGSVPAQAQVALDLSYRWEVANWGDFSVRAAGTYFTLLYPSTFFACTQDCMWWLQSLPQGALGSERRRISPDGRMPPPHRRLHIVLAHHVIQRGDAAT